MFTVLIFCCYRNFPSLYVGTYACSKKFWFFISLRRVILTKKVCFFYSILHNNLAYHINNSKDVYSVTQKINQMILPAYVLIHIRKLMGGYDLHHKIQNSISSQRKKDQSECWSGVLSVSMGPLVIMEGIVDWWSTSNHNIVCSFIMLWEVVCRYKFIWSIKLDRYINTEIKIMTVGRIHSK